jgi:hypothetical protein
MTEQTPLTDVSFADFIRVNGFVLVHFRAVWNGYDAEMRRIIESQIPDDVSQKIATPSIYRWVHHSGACRTSVS